MKKDIKERWLTALRSGKYQQGKENLNYDGKFCCLGVLAEIAVEDGVVHSEHEASRVVYLSKYGERSTALLSPTLVAWSGIGDESGRFFKECGDYESLTHLNDSGMSFNDIADVIEERF